MLLEVVQMLHSDVTFRSYILMLHSDVTFCFYILLHSVVTFRSYKNWCRFRHCFNRCKLLFINLSDSDISLVQYRPHKNE